MAKQLGFTEQQKNIISKPIDEKYIKKTPDNFNFIENALVVDILNRAFNYAWNWEITEFGIEPCRASSKNKEVIGSYVWVKGRLSIPLEDEEGKIYFITKEAFGGHMLVGNAKVQSQTYKSASSEALKKAASLFGLAKNVYMKEDLYYMLEEDAANEDIWTEIAVKQLENECLIVSKIKEIIGEKELEKLQLTFCDETGNYTTRGVISPSNIKDFIEYVKVLKPELFTENASSIQKNTNSNPFSNLNIK